MKARSNQAYGRAEHVANPSSAGPWTDWRPFKCGWPIEMAVVLDQGDHSSRDDHVAKAMYRVKNRNIMPNYGTTQNLTAGDNLLFSAEFLR